MQRFLILCAAGCFPLAAAAQGMDVISGIDLGATFADRGGSALNSSGTPDEADRFRSLTIDGFATANFGPGIRAQVEGSLDATDIGEFVSGNPADDSATDHRQLALQLGYAMDSWYAGVFAASGLVNFNQSDSDQDADFSAFGLAAAYHGAEISVGLQAGHLNASAENLEVLDDFTFGRVSGHYFLNQGQSAFGASLGYGSGLQDSDDFITNDVELWETAFWYEQTLGQPVLGGQGSLRVGLSNLIVDEQSTSGDVDRVSEVRLELGLRILFGGGSPQDRVRGTAERLPSFGRWNGLTPVVD